MKLRHAVLAAALAVGGAPAFGANVEDLTKQLSGEAALVARTPAELERAYAEVLPSLLAKAETDDVGLQKIAFRASRPGAEAERAALSKVLAGKLSGDAATPVKVVLLRHLQRIGRDEAVKAVAGRLADGDALVRESARRALAGMPVKSASDALRAEYEKATEPAWKAALLTAIAYRRDPGDMNTFANAVANDAEAVRIAGMLALARTGDAQAAPILSKAREKGSPAAKRVANDAYLLLADRLAGTNNKGAAAGIYREFLYAPGQERYTAIVGLGSVGNADDVVRLVGVLGDKDVEARGAALEALAKNRHAVIANEIVARLGKADAAARPWLLRALLGQQDKRAKQFMVEAAGSEDSAVRLAGLQGLAQVGDASSVEVLLKSAQAKGEEQAAARAALDTLAGKEIDAALLERLAGGGEAAQRVEVIRTLGARLTKDAAGPLFEAVKDQDASVRGEAYKSLALVAGVDALPRAVGLVEGAKEDAERAEAVKAVVAIARKSDDVDGRAGPVLAAAEKAEGPTKAALLNALGQLGGAKALAAIKGAIASEDPKVHEAGVRALVNWPDAGPAKDVLELAKSETNNTLSILALRGYIRMVGLPSQRKAGETVKMLQDAMAAAKRNDEKKMVLGGLGEVKDVAALDVVAPFLEAEGLQGEACAAAIKIGREAANNVKNAAAVKGAMTKVLEISKQEGQKKAAKEVMEKVEGKEKKG